MTTADENTPTVEDPNVRRVAKSLQASLAQPGWNLKLDDNAAYAIAEAITAPDTRVSKRERIPRQQWEQDGYRSWHEKSARHSLVVEALDNGCYPVGLPKQKLFYYAMNHPNSPIPHDVVNGGYPWDYVEVLSTLYVRKSFE